MICIFTPYVLTIAALICLIVVGLGSTDNGTDSLRDLYFFRVCLLSRFVDDGRASADVSRPICKI
jgi:hypothetical protein